MSKLLGGIIGCKYKTSSWHLNLFPYGSNTGSVVVVVVAVVDSHIQRIVLATEETTVTQQVSHRPIKCQSRLWSQRGTKKVNGSHHGNNPLLRDQQGSKSRQKVMRLYKQWHRPHNIGEKPAVILYTYVNRHEGTPEKQ